jgi:ABC-type phosphate transport system substrate-binding protein
MINIKKPVVLGVVASLALGIFAAVPAAHADPVSNSYVLVGSDTLQDVVNALANGTSVTGANVLSTAGNLTVGSFDATGSTSIQTKPYGPRFGRPNGSGDGVNALSRSIDGQPYTSGTPGGPANVTITGQVDIARSSSGPVSVNASSGALLYIPFGRDALAYAYTGTDAAFQSIDAATLKAIFQCTQTTVGTSGATVTPVIPQAGSGTRKDFLKKIGIGADYPSGVVPSCVKVGQEHDTSKLEDGSPFPTDGLAPMSAAQWVAQTTGAGIDRRGATAKIGSPIGTSVSPVTGTGTGMVPNAAYFNDTTWGRDIYLVVENARVTVGDPKYDANLADLVSTAKAKMGNITNSTPGQAGSVKKKFGFLAPLATTTTRADLQ